MPGIEIGEQNHIVGKLNLNTDARHVPIQVAGSAQVGPASADSVPPIPSPKGKARPARGQPQAHLLRHPPIGIAEVWRNASAIRAEDTVALQAFPGRNVLDSPEDHSKHDSMSHGGETPGKRERLIGMPGVVAVRGLSTRRQLPVEWCNAEIGGET